MFQFAMYLCELKYRMFLIKKKVLIESLLINKIQAIFCLAQNTMQTTLQKLLELSIREKEHGKQEDQGRI